jgi:hypothetical protein
MSKKGSCVVSTAVVMAIAAMMLFPVTGAAQGKQEAQMPRWSQKLQCDATDCPRFQLVLDGAAVLDKETGLVWEKTPAYGNVNWVTALSFCYDLNLGGRRGWHLPAYVQLLSLNDPSVPFPAPALPAGHPFSNVQPHFYWSATTHAIYNTYALNFYFYGGIGSDANKGQTGSAWCVRGEETYDPR